MKETIEVNKQHVDGKPTQAVIIVKRDVPHKLMADILRPGELVDVYLNSAETAEDLVLIAINQLKTLVKNNEVPSSTKMVRVIIEIGN